MSGLLALDEPRESDIPALLKHLADKAISDKTFRIPYPYTEKNARDFLKTAADEKRIAGQPRHWAIRLDGELIGVIGLTANERGADREIGFWLAKPYWNRGFMTESIRRLTTLAFETLGLERLEMRVFAHNAASCRVAEKCGFRFEGLEKEAFEKNGRRLDVRLYSKTRA